MNYYRDFRQSVYNQQEAKMGEFDPMSTVVFLDSDVARYLDAGSGNAGTDIESVGSPVLGAFCTYFHEIVHWWQHIGSTAGFLYSLSIPMQARCTSRYLGETGTKLRKPLVKALSKELLPDDPAILTVCRWSEIEFACGLVLSPSRANALLMANPRFYESLGQSMLLSQISTVAGLARIFDPDHRALPHAEEWIELLQHFVSSRRKYFEPYQLFEIPLGMLHIMEGQARLIELQYRALTFDHMSYADAKQQGYLNADYAVAFDFFLKMTGLAVPEHFDDAVVNLFLLLCDIALNPCNGYPDEIDPDRDFVGDQHPGMRFVMLCQEVRENPGIAGEVEKIGYKSYVNASQRLCKRLNWPDPITVGQRCVTVGTKMSGYPKLQRQFEECDFGVEDVPIRFYLKRHLEFMEIKSECPHFFCWPARFLAVARGEEDEADAFQKMLWWSMPPFVTSSFSSGVTATNLEIGDHEKRLKFATNYFATIALYDMVRQWISNQGPFQFEYRWKDALTETELQAIWGQFEKSFGISHSSILF